MDWNQLFSISSTLALLCWVVLILGPRRMRWLTRAGPELGVPLALSVSYAALAVPGFLMSADGGYGSIDEVRALLSTDRMMVAGWQHYLAFDLLVGAWCAQRLDALSISRLIQAPILLAVFMFGPAGFLLSIVTETLVSRLRPAVKEPLS